MIVGMLAFCVFLATVSRPVERHCANHDQAPGRGTRKSLWRGFFIRYVGRTTQPNQHRATFLKGPVQRFPLNLRCPLAVLSSSSGSIGGGSLDHLPPMGTAPAGFCRKAPASRWEMRRGGAIGVWRLQPGAPVWPPQAFADRCCTQNSACSMRGLTPSAPLPAPRVA